MKKTFMFMILGLFLVLAINAVSATTVVAGKVYNADYTLKINDATVNVTCTRNGTPYFNSTTSFGDGDYIVKFTSDQCALNDTISVSGYHPGYGSGVGDGAKINVDMTQPNDIALGVSNIPLIPEFGFFVGALTLLGAVGVFFLVRRK